MRKNIRSLAALAVPVLIGVSACGGASGSGSGSDSGSGGGMSISVSSPGDGGDIQIPFKVNIKSSVPLGPEETGLHHVHLYFDGKENSYEIVRGTSWNVPKTSPAVAGLKPGEHEMDISLRNADHSPAGADSKVMVMVGNAGGPAGGGGGNGGGGDDGGYGGY